MLVGVFGLTVPIISFGLSRTFWSLVARSLSSLEPESLFLILDHRIVDPSGGCWTDKKVVHHILSDHPEVQPAPAIGIGKSIVGDITNSSNQAKAFAFMLVIWQIGATVGYVVAPVPVGTERAEFYPTGC